MARFIWHNDQWVPAVRAVRVSAFPAIIRDQMDATWHPATGEMVESKSQFRAITKARGYEEVGNDTAPLFERPAPAPDPTIERDIAIDHGLWWLHQQIQQIADSDRISVAAFIRAAVLKELRLREKEGAK